MKLTIVLVALGCILSSNAKAHMSSNTHVSTQTASVQSVVTSGPTTFEVCAPRNYFGPYSVYYVAYTPLAQLQRWVRFTQADIDMANRIIQNAEAEAAEVCAVATRRDGSCGQAITSEANIQNYDGSRNTCSRVRTHKGVRWYSSEFTWSQFDQTFRRSR